jgi:rhodanese-related sulfurtransferase
MPARRSLARRIGIQFATLLGLSAVLGFAFNAASPIGVRFGGVVTSSEPGLPSLTNFNLVSSASVAATVTQPIPQPTTQTMPRPPIPRLPIQAQAHTPTTAPPALPVIGSTATTAVASTVQTNLNPAPIHWREAKPLVTAGQALLVDVRLAAVYDAGHIPDAISLPESSSAEVINAFLKQVPTNLTLIVYCGSTSCSQSKRVAERLVGTHKWGAVKYMTGGYQEYQQEELARGQPQQ